jgi:hypothetical protein
MTFKEWFATSPLASWLRVFGAVILSAAVADWSTKGSIDLGAWQTWVIAGLVSALPTAMRYLNPSDVEFGRGSWRDDRFDIWADEDEA